MPNEKSVTNEELLEFMREKVATKEDLEQFATKEDLEQFATKEDLEQFATKEDLRDHSNDLHNMLDGIAKQLMDLKTEMAANQAAHDRFENRDKVFAEKLHIDLFKVDA